MSARTWLFAIPIAFGAAGAPLGAAGLGARVVVDTAVIDELAALEPRLRHTNAEERRKAVAELGKIASSEALERLLPMLGDAEARVADEAQLALGAWTRAEDAPRILAALDIDRGAYALRVAEALGRLPFALEAAGLAETLKKRDAARRSVLCFSIERLARAGRIGGDPAKELAPALESLVREREPRLRADALLALVAVAPDRSRVAVRQFADDARPEARAAAAIAAGRFGDAEASALAARLVADPTGAVRVRAAQSLAAIGDKAAAGTLALRLGEEPEPRVVRELVRLLQRLSGLKHGADARPWAAWAEALADDWRAGDSAKVRTEDEAPGATTAAFAGLPVRSSRVAFLIDLSGSMWDVRADGATRKQAVDGELLRALEALPPETLFNVIAFTQQPFPWKKSATQANERAVRDAVRWFDALKHRGAGDYWGALELALADPEIDTVIFFGDGAPSGGTRWNLELMRTLLEHENRYRAVAIDAVLVDLSRRVGTLWGELTTSTGGVHIEVEL